jgi:DNA mismatch repair protein MutS
MNKFFSILFLNPTETVQQRPQFFDDLNLVPVTDNIASGKEEYDLKPFFYTPLQNIEAIHYRHEVMLDLENANVYGCIQSFALSMQLMRRQLPKDEKRYYKRYKERLFLDAVKLYCDAVRFLANDLSHQSIHSQGLIQFVNYLQNYIQSVNFVALLTETSNLLNDLSSVHYCVWTKNLKLSVRNYRSEPDYTKEIEQVFDKFRHNAKKDYRTTAHATLEMNDVEARILEGVAQLYPELFERLEIFFQLHSNFQNETIVSFEREIQFYLAYLDYISVLKKQGLQFCFPEMSETGKDVYSCEGFDLALAYKLNREETTVVCNDFYLKGNERIIIVTGPNQGGKTTFARTFGQLHYLAALGCPVPGSKAKLFLFDHLFTHFEKEENIINFRSKLEDDLVRIHHILNESTSQSIIIMNEILSSTTLDDALFLSKEVMKAISELDALCIWVSFIDELLSLSDKTVSMVSMVVPDNPDLRTFKIERRPADGLAYARSIAEKYKLTYSYLKDRLKF